jgi:uncharacterized small protein (DUF1192 family)
LATIFSKALIDSNQRSVNIESDNFNVKTECLDMDDEEFLPRNTNDPLALLIREDLDPLSVDELEERISVLKSEINRCEAKKNFSVSHRASADNLFKK